MREIGRGAYGSDISLSGTIKNTSIDGWSWITLDARASTLGAKVHIDSEELVLSIKRLPCGCQGLSACSPRYSVQRINSAGVEFQLGTRENNLSVGAGTLVGFAETDDGWVVEV